MAINSAGKGDQQRAKELFELVADSVPGQFKARAILSLAAVMANTCDFDSEGYYLIESIKASESINSILRVQRGIALYKAREGYHKQALRDLESMLPVMRLAPPFLYFDYLNSLAVELGEAGCKDEACNVIGHVLASPYAHAYPEWRETAHDLMPANRSFIVPNPSPAQMGKLLTMPIAEPAERVKQDKPAGIINLQQWKTKMGKDKDKEEGKYSPNMAEDKMLREIINLFTADDMDREVKFQMLESIAVIVAKKRAKKYNKDYDKDKDKD